MVSTKIRLIIFFAAKDRENLWSQQKEDRADSGSGNKLLTAKYRLKLKKVGKTTRPFRYNLIKSLMKVKKRAYFPIPNPQNG